MREGKTIMDIGVIGLGLLGKAMAGRLMAAGHTVAGYDLKEAACKEAAAMGVAVADSARAVGPQVPLLILSLMTSDDRRRLLWGDQALAAVLPQGMVVLDTTTARPADLRADHERLAEQGVRLVDVCISGSSQVVRDGEALALVGDRRADADGYTDILAAFTKAQYYFNFPGQGNCAKLIVNTVFGLNRLVLAEALGLAAKGGFELELMLEVLRQGETYSTAMDTKGPKMIAGQYEPAAARLAQHAKDVDLILEYAAEVGARTPVSQLHRALLDYALALGAGDLDNAAIFKFYS
jgi:3-hydroxyisobutyrate dehydrogenase-like beta-hydroxyacid dehydrogenase